MNFYFRLLVGWFVVLFGLMTTFSAVSLVLSIADLALRIGWGYPWWSPMVILLFGAAFFMATRRLAKFARRLAHNDAF